MASHTAADAWAVRSMIQVSLRPCGACMNLHSVAAHVPPEFSDGSLSCLTPARGCAANRDGATHVIDVDARAAHTDAHANLATG